MGYPKIPRLKKNLSFFLLYIYKWEIHLLKTTIVIEKTSIITFSVTLPEYHITTIDKWLSAQRSNNWHTPERLTSTHHIQQNHLAINFWAYVQEGTSHEEPIINAINVSFSRNLTYTTVSFFFFFSLGTGGTSYVDQYSSKDLLRVEPTCST